MSLRRGPTQRDPLVGVGSFLLMLAAACVAEWIMVSLGSPQHVWFWCALLRVC